MQARKAGANKPNFNPKPKSERNKQMKLAKFAFTAAVAAIASAASAQSAVADALDSLSDAPAAEATAPSSKVDARARSAMEASGLKYSIDDDGDFRIIIGFDDKRDHLVIVNSNTESYKDIEIREVWAVAAKSEQFSRKRLFTLLEKNSKYKFGHWSVRRSNDKDTAIFCCQVPANINGDDLRSVINLVAVEADKVEEEWTDADQF